MMPERVTLDFDATLITAHSEKEGAAGNFKGGFGFHPLVCYLDESNEALSGILRPGNAGANTAADHIAVLHQATSRSGVIAAMTRQAVGLLTPILAQLDRP